MMKLRIAAAAAMLAVTGAALGGNVSATVGLVSDYDFRGITQSRNDPAFQMGMTYTGDSGIYYGLWGSTVDFQGSASGATDYNSDIDRPSTEIDIFEGFSSTWAWAKMGYDLGVIYYTYPNAGHNNYPEAYAGITKGPLSLKLWYSWDFANTNESGVYTEANLAVPLSDGFKFLGHAGYTDASGWSSVGNYFDWAAGFSYDTNNFTLSLKYVDGSDLKVPASARAPQNLGRFIFGVSTTLPFGK